MKILVTGANGFLGRYLVTALQEGGDSVRALVLPSEDASWLRERHVAVYSGDVRKPETLVDPMASVDGVVHLAAMMGVWRPMKDYNAVNVTGTENVCQAALRARVHRFVHVSSWTVYGMNLGRPATEDLPLAPLNEPYAVTKAEGDKLVQRMIAENQLPAVIIRPGTFFGPGDRLHFGRIADRLRSGRWVTIGSGRNSLPLVYVTDVVQGLILALIREQATGQAYNITNDQPLAQQDAWRTIAEEIGAPPPRIRVPYRALLAAGYAAEQVARVTHASHQPIVTRLGVMLFGGDNRHSIEKAQRELGYSPRVTLHDGVRLSAAWYRNQSQLATSSKAKSTKPGHVSGR